MPRASGEKGLSETVKTDWMTIASRAIELLPKPAAVLDRKGTIFLFNEEMQRLLGRGRDEAVDRSWFDLCVPKEAQEATRACFEQVMRGALAECECRAVTKSGIHLRLRLDASCVGTGPQAALLAVVRESEREESEADSALDGTHYEISVAPHDWGTLRSVRTSAGSMPGARGQPCYLALEKRQTPCPQCPVQAIKDGEITTAVIASNDSDLPLRLVSARAVKGQGAAVIGRVLDDKVIAQIVDAKLLVVAKQKHLSPRERDVLRSLLRGDSSQDIATALGISPRTVKFHQANLLRKLGAESRLELVRWLL